MTRTDEFMMTYAPDYMRRKQAIRRAATLENYTRTVAFIFTLTCLVVSMP